MQFSVLRIYLKVGYPTQVLSTYLGLGREHQTEPRNNRGHKNSQPAYQLSLASTEFFFLIRLKVSVELT